MDALGRAKAAVEALESIKLAKRGAEDYLKSVERQRKARVKALVDALAEMGADRTRQLYHGSGLWWVEGSQHYLHHETTTILGMGGGPGGQT